MYPQSKYLTTCHAQPFCLDQETRTNLYMPFTTTIKVAIAANVD